MYLSQVLNENSECIKASPHSSLIEKISSLGMHVNERHPQLADCYFVSYFVEIYSNVYSK